MGLRVRREAVDEFEIQNGHYPSTNINSTHELTSLLHGHPRGIFELILQRHSATILVSRAMVLIPPNRPRKLDNPVQIRQMSGEVGDVDIWFGQTYTTTSSGIIQAIIYRGASILLESQGENMTLTHTDYV